MKKSLMTAALLVGLAAGAFAQKDVIVLEDGRTRDVSNLQADAKGVLSFKEGKFTTKLKPGDYKYANIAKPKEIAAADALLESNPAKAAAAYDEAYDKYRFLGWDTYCIAKQGEALNKSGNRKAAIEKLQQLQTYKVVNPNTEAPLVEGLKNCVALYIEDGEFDNAVRLIDALAKGTSDAGSAFAFLKKGDIEAKKGNVKDAALLYMQCGLLFPKTEEAPEALYKAYNSLNQLKDARAAKFADLLRNGFPTSSWTKKL